MSISNGKDSHQEEISTPVSGMYENYFLDYASYVILERAVPLLMDGLKPVQRRILHALKTMDDGRFHKIANVIGQTMQYHPHGDAAIGDALVNMGQKDLMIDTQGNWGDYRIPDSGELDLGAGEFSPAEKYWGNGWESYMKVRMGSTETERKKAYAEEYEEWWK